MSIPKQGPVVAIDGPAGTGKSSATRRLADALHFIHVDTGALYRAVALLTLEKSGGEIVPNFEALASEVAKAVQLEFRRMPNKNPANRIFANGRDVTSLIRTPEVTMTASKVSAFPVVRSCLLGLQRRLGCVGQAILEGRDIGTVVFPDADVKFFLTASVEERAKRRLIELEAAGADTPLSLDEVKRQIIERDEVDSHRPIAPLKKAIDAIEIDTSNMSLDEVVRTMEERVRMKV